MNLDRIIREVQRAIGAEIDGKAGPETWRRIYAKIIGHPPTSGDDSRRSIGDATAVDVRSARTIATLLPEVQPYARALMEKAAAHGITIRIISGTRSYEEQNALYAKGRTAPGPRVTNAKGGFSNHNFGIAFDVGIFDGNDYVPESPLYAVVGALGRELGLEWGGDWKSFVDEPHFQLRPKWARGMAERAFLAELRERKESGTAIFTT